MRLLNRFAGSPWVGAALVLSLMWIHLQSFRPAQAPAFVYHQVTHQGYDYSWALEKGAIDMRVEKAQYFWRFSCPQQSGDDLHVSIVDSRFGVWHDLYYKAGQLKPFSVTSVNTASRFADYSAWAEKWSLDENMRRICPNGW